MGLFGKASQRHEPRLASPWRVPTGRRIYAIGDIHGRLDLLVQLHDAIRDDAGSAAGLATTAVYLGDYIDRGEHSREVIDLLLDAPLPGFENVCLKGNHEEMMLMFLDDSRIGETWMWNGAGATLRSYGVEVTAAQLSDGPAIADRYGAWRQVLADCLPGSHGAFLHGLGMSYQAGDYLFVHAGIRPGVPLPRQQPQDMVWIRGAFLHSQANHGVCVVHGHTIFPEPNFNANRIGIDTGAYATDRLTCLVLEDDAQRILQT